MPWTDIPATDTDVDSPVDEDIMQALADNDEALRVVPAGFSIAQVTSTSTSYVTVATRYVFLPNVAGTSFQRKLVFRFEARVDSGGTGTYKITDNAAAVDSNEVTTTSTSYEDKTVTLNFAESLKGTLRQIDIKAKYTSVSPAYLRILDSITSELFF